MSDLKNQLHGELRDCDAFLALIDAEIAKWADTSLAANGKGTEQIVAETYVCAAAYGEHPTVDAMTRVCLMRALLARSIERDREVLGV